MLDFRIRQNRSDTPGIIFEYSRISMRLRQLTRRVEPHGR